VDNNDHPDATCLSEADLDLTMAAEFTPMTDRYGPGLPVVTLAGIQVYTYIEDGRLRVSVSLDTTDEVMLHGPDRLVPMQIDVQNDTVFEG